MTDQFNTHPQPRTFAPSKEDVLQNLQYFFGAPVSPEKLKDYSEHHAMTYHFPGAPRTAAVRACASAARGPHAPTCVCARAQTPTPVKIPRFGANPSNPARRCPCHARPTHARPPLCVRSDTLNNLILKSPQSWQTSVGLPFFQIQGTVVEWDEVRFDVRLMQRVPYEGVSRMQTSLRRRHRDRVVRCASAPPTAPPASPCIRTQLTPPSPCPQSRPGAHH